MVLFTIAALMGAAPFSCAHADSTPLPADPVPSVSASPTPSATTASDASDSDPSDAASFNAYLAATGPSPTGLPSPIIPSIAVTDPNARADMATDEMLAFWDEQKKIFPQPNSYDDDGGAIYWYYANILDALNLAIERNCKDRTSPKCAHYRSWFVKLYEAERRRTSPVFLTPEHSVDDESWMALTLVRAYNVTHVKKYLARAEKIFADLLKSGEVNGSYAQGLVMDPEHAQMLERNTATNALPAVAAGELFIVTMKQSYLTIAQTLYAGWRQTMVLPNFQTCDTIKVPVAGQPPVKFCTEFPVDYTYDTGMMAGAAAILYRITKDPKYLADARGMAGFIMQHFATKGPLPVLLELFCSSDQNNCGISDQELFKGVTYRFLGMVLEIDPGNAALKKFLTDTANSIWNDARDPSDGSFSAEWQGERNPTHFIAAQASAVIALNLFPLID